MAADPGVTALEGGRPMLLRTEELAHSTERACAAFPDCVKGPAW
ncbi:MAG TPA: hypothetical protein VL984_04320 [Acidimicrobiales bacterium]|nr:hypothetical protein [Acidimicrobiales bacterium]